MRSLVTPSGAIRYSRTSSQTPVWVTAQVLTALARKPFPVRPAPRARRPRSAAATPAPTATPAPSATPAPTAAPSPAKPRAEHAEAKPADPAEIGVAEPEIAVQRVVSADSTASMMVAVEPLLVPGNAGYAGYFAGVLARTWLPAGAPG